MVNYNIEFIRSNVWLPDVRKENDAGSGPFRFVHKQVQLFTVSFLEQYVPLH